MPKLLKEKTALYLGAAQLKALRKIAEAHDVSISRHVREGVDLVIKKYSKTS